MGICERTTYMVTLLLTLIYHAHSNSARSLSTAPSCDRRNITLSLGNRTCNCLQGLCCLDNTGNTTCQCGSLYSGSKCEGVSLDLPVACAVTPTSITFTWKSLPNLNSAIFVYYLRQWHYHTYPILSTKKINFLDDGKSIRLDSLSSGGVAYVACVLHNSTMVNVTSEMIPEGVFSEIHSHCLSFRTKYDGKDPFTQAAIYVGITIVAIFFLVLGIYCGRMCSHSPAGRNSIRRIRKSIKQVTKTFDPAVTRVRTSWAGVSRKLKRKSKWAKHPPTKREHRENGIFEEVKRPTSEFCEKKSGVIGTDVVRNANVSPLQVVSGEKSDSVARNNQKRYVSATERYRRHSNNGPSEVQLRNKNGMPTPVIQPNLQNHDVLPMATDPTQEPSAVLEEPICKQVYVLSKTSSKCQVSTSPFPLTGQNGEPGAERASIIHELDVILEEPCDSQDSGPP